MTPKGTNYAKYRGATVIKPNLQEIERFWKEEIHDEPSLLEAGRRLVDFPEGSTVLVTRGADGMSLFGSHSKPALPTRSVSAGRPR